jgi:hypothetical protein
VLVEPDVAQDMGIQALEIGRNDPMSAASAVMEDAPDHFPSMN